MADLAAVNLVVGRTRDGLKLVRRSGLKGGFTGTLQIAVKTFTLASRQGLGTLAHLQVTITT